MKTTGKFIGKWWFPAVVVCWIVWVTPFIFGTSKATRSSVSLWQLNQLEQTLEQLHSKVSAIDTEVTRQRNEDLESKITDFEKELESIGSHVRSIDSQLSEPLPTTLTWGNPRLAATADRDTIYSRLKSIRKHHKIDAIRGHIYVFGNSSSQVGREFN